MPVYNTATEQMVGTTQPALQSLHSTLTNRLDEQWSTISAIEEKLHSIMTRRLPEKVESDKSSDSPNDFVSGSSIQISRITSHNFKLEAILKHLSEII